MKTGHYSFDKARCLESGKFAMGGIPELAMTFERSTELPKLMRVFDLKGELGYEFGDMHDYKDPLENHRGNWYNYDVDKEGNIYLSFRYQNRIEKYTAKGKLLWRADRILNYRTGIEKKGFIQHKRGNTIIQSPEMNTVSSGISVDNEGRVWVVTLNRQLSLKETGSIVSGSGGTIIKDIDQDTDKTDAYKLEVFDSDGSLLGEIHLNHHVHGIRICRDSLFMWERNNSKIFQYEIIK
jgi:hypothetical protein